MIFLGRFKMPKDLLVALKKGAENDVTSSWSVHFWCSSLPYQDITEWLVITLMKDTKLLHGFLSKESQATIDDFCYEPSGEQNLLFPYQVDFGQNFQQSRKFPCKHHNIILNFFVASNSSPKCTPLCNQL